MPARYALTRTLAPTQEPVVASELKSHLRIVATDTGQELELQRYIQAAREQFELRTDQAVMQQQWTLELRHLDTATQLPHPPLVSVDSPTYVDTDNVTQVVDPATYQIYTASYPGLLVRMLDQQWPTGVSQSILYPWQVLYTVGAATQQDVPQGVRQAILMLAGYFYEHRVTCEANTMVEIPHSFEAIVSQHRVFSDFVP